MHEKILLFIQRWINIFCLLFNDVWHLYRLFSSTVNSLMAWRFETYPPYVARSFPLVAFLRRPLFACTRRRRRAASPVWNLHTWPTAKCWTLLWILLHIFDVPFRVFSGTFQHYFTGLEFSISVFQELCFQCFCQHLFSKILNTLSWFIQAIAFMHYMHFMMMLFLRCVTCGVHSPCMMYTSPSVIPNKWWLL